MPAENVFYPLSRRAKNYVKNTLSKCYHPPPIRSEVKESFGRKTGFRRYYLCEKKGLYRGWWKNNLRDGLGTQINEEKAEVYEGFYDQDNRCGYGVVSARKPTGKSEFIYEGDFANGLPNGSGTLHTDMYRYIGRVVNGKASGFGIAWFKDGTIYVGAWLNGKRMGTGMQVNKDRTRYEGSWYNDKKHGYGQYCFFDRGQALEGVWVADLCKKGIVRNIKYRQAARNPSKYPIPELMLADWATTYYQWEKEALAMVGKYVRDDMGIPACEKKEESETSTEEEGSSNGSEQDDEQSSHQFDVYRSEDSNYPGSLTELQPCISFI